MATERKNRFFLKLLLWFIFLSTLGVGGGIFFLLFAVVPIEQSFTDRGWSQYKIDQVMKYFVVGWVVFGFALSFVYYFLIVKRNRWLWSWLLAAGTVFLCTAALYYFLNTGTGVVQASQGEVVEGERFTFGPFPEKEDLLRLKEQGYDGVITLLNPALPIEKPLLDQEKKNAEEAGLEVHSLPMLPWVGDNSESIGRVKELIQKDEKKYYVHCYLGRHRVDVIKQVINEELGDDTYLLRFMQPTTLERGGLFHFPEQSILIGPYPTDEEWFTRIKRGEVQEVVSLLADEPTGKWQSKEAKVTKEMDMTYTPMPVPANPSIEQIQNIADYVLSQDHKVYVHAFKNNMAIEMLEAYIDWGSVLLGEEPPVLHCGKTEWIGRKLIVGCQPDKKEMELLRSNGVKEFTSLDGLTVKEQYEEIKRVKRERKPSYLTIAANEQPVVKRIAVGLLYGSIERGKEWETLEFAEGTPTRHDRNVIAGPMLQLSEFETFALEKGVAQIIFLYSPSITSVEEKEEVVAESARLGIRIEVIPMVQGFEEQMIPLIEAENGLNYIMTEPELLPQINAYLRSF